MQQECSWVWNICSARHFWHRILIGKLVGWIVLILWAQRNMTKHDTKALYTMSRNSMSQKHICFDEAWILYSCIAAGGLRSVPAAASVPPMPRRVPTATAPVVTAAAALPKHVPVVQATDHTTGTAAVVTLAAVLRHAPVLAATYCTGADVPMAAVPPPRPAPATAVTAWAAAGRPTAPQLWQSENRLPLAIKPPIVDWIAAAVEPADTPTVPNPTAESTTGAAATAAAAPTVAAAPVISVLRSTMFDTWRSVREIRESETMLRQSF